MEKEYLKKEKYLNAVKRVKEIKGFYTHLTVYLLTNIGISLIILYANDFRMQSISLFSTWFFWGIGVFTHGISIFGKNLVLGRNWEQRKIQEILDKEEESRNR